MRWIWACGFFCLVSLNTTGQIVDNRYCSWTRNSLIEVDESLVIDRSSISIVGIPDSLYSITYDSESGLIKAEVSGVTRDSILICYRRLEIPRQWIYHRSLSEYDSSAKFKGYEQLLNGDPLFIEKSKLIQTGNVQTGGRLSRGFSVGSNRDMLMNSSLNLTMEGKLSNDLNIQAVITDQTIPFQPEGNTAQLQDFDNVFMKIYNEKISIIGGDILLANPASRFLRYNKNVQGVSVRTSGDRSSSYAGASVAKGKFTTVKILSIEGVSGPYRIPGPSGQDFVVVLANSERVYLDGKLLRRGYDLDYTIDYNLGEIVFTPSIIITNFSRIRVDYEYADASFMRSIFATGYTREIGNGFFFINAYSEKDNKNKPVMDLSDSNRKLLAEAGDDFTKAITLSADSIGYDPQKVMYKKILNDDQEIFVYSTHPDSAHWVVFFSNVGLNNGNYVQKNSTANGRVFEFVPPQDGVPQGDHSPFRLLNPPSKKQMVTLGGELNVTEYETIAFEGAGSANDKNLYSQRDNDDNLGGAANLSFRTVGRPLGNTDYQLKALAEFDYLSRDFSPIDRFRDVEFNRDWGYLPQTQDTSSSDVLLNIGIGATKDALNNFSYGFSRRLKGDYVNGFQHLLSANLELNNFRIRGEGFLSSNQTFLSRSDWEKLKIDLSKKFGVVRPGYALNIQRNSVIRNDSVLYSADFFTEHTFYIKSSNEAKSSFNLAYSLRDDELPLEGQMQKRSRSHTLTSVLHKTINDNHKVDLTFSYRELSNLNDSLNFGSGQSITGRLDWSGSFLSGAIRNDLTYSISNGRELRKEYVFVQVPTGQGSFNWVDINDDGVQDLNEFFLAVNIDERNYAKIFIPTSEYIDAYESTFNYRLNARFPSSWKNGSGMKSILQKLSNSTVWTSTSKIIDSSLSSRLFPFAKKLDRSDVLSMNENFRTTFFFNRGNPAYGLNGGYHQIRNLNLLTGGFEDRMIKELVGVGRISIGRSYSLKLDTRMGREFSESDFLNNRNFIIKSSAINPTFSWQPKPSFRIGMKYGRRFRSNIADPERGETAIIDDLSGEVRLSRFSKTNLQGTLTLSNVEFRGDARTPAGFAVLSGLQPGFNLNWNISWQQTLIDGLQLVLNYHGRKSEESRVIHLGSATVSALF